MSKIKSFIPLFFIGTLLSNSAFSAVNKESNDTVITSVLKQQEAINQRITDSYSNAALYLTVSNNYLFVISIIMAIVGIGLPIYLTRIGKKNSDDANRERENFVRRAENDLAKITEELAAVKLLKESYSDALAGGLQNDGGKNSSTTKAPIPPANQTSGSKEDLLYQGNKAHYEGQYNSAIEFYTNLLLLTPNDSIVYNNIALTYAKKGADYYSKALEFYDTALSKDAYNLLAKQNKGELLYTMDKYDDALKCFDEILQVSQNANTYNYKGLIYEKKCDFERSLACYRKAYELAPNVLIYKQNILGAMLLNKQVNDAKPLIQELELTIPSGWTAKMLGHIALLGGDTNEAEKLYDLALSRVDGIKEKIEALNFMLSNDLTLGKAVFTDSFIDLQIIKNWANSRIKELRNMSS